MRDGCYSTNSKCNFYYLHRDSFCFKDDSIVSMILIMIYQMLYFKETSLDVRDINLVLLTRTGLRTSEKFRSLISHDDYYYFSGLPSEACRGEKVKLAYVHWASTVLDFGFTGQEKVFMSDHLCRERGRLKKMVSDLTL